LFQDVHQIGHFDEQLGLHITFLLNFCHTNPFVLKKF
jgi:hypothetical protein